MLDNICFDNCIYCGSSMDEDGPDVEVYVDEVYFPNEFYKLSFCSTGCFKRYIEESTDRILTVRMPLRTLNHILGGKNG